MRGHVRRRSPVSWEFIADIGLAAAQRCQSCNKRFWVERRPKGTCPSCGGRLIETEERRRQTKAGFTTRKECAAAMNKLLVAVEEQTFVASTKLSVKEFLTKEWLPAVEATIRPTTYRSYCQHVHAHIVPHIGSVKLQKLSGAQVNRSTRSSRRRASATARAASHLAPFTTCTPVCTRPARTRSDEAT